MTGALKGVVKHIDNTQIVSVRQKVEEGKVDRGEGGSIIMISITLQQPVINNMLRSFNT